MMNLKKLSRQVKTFVEDAVFEAAEKRRYLIAFIVISLFTVSLYNSGVIPGFSNSKQSSSNQENKEKNGPNNGGSSNSEKDQDNYLNNQDGYDFFKPSAKTSSDLDVDPNLILKEGFTTGPGEAMSIANVVPASEILDQLVSEFNCNSLKTSPIENDIKIFGNLPNDTLAICEKGNPELQGAVVFILTAPEAIKFYSNLEGTELSLKYKFSYVLKSKKAIVISTGGIDSFDGSEISFNILRYKGYDPSRPKLY